MLNVSLAKLNRRIERLNWFYANGAPSVIIDTELKLIKEACDELAELNNKRGEKHV